MQQNITDLLNTHTPAELDKITPKFSLGIDNVTAICTKVYDGDTVHLIFDAHGNIYKFSCRCLGYNTAEIHSKDPLEKDKAIRARDFVTERIYGKVIRASIDSNFDKYGRVLVDIKYANDANELVSLKDEILAANLAKPYNGYGEKSY